MLSRAVYPRRRGRRLLTALAGLTIITGTFVVGNVALASTPAGEFELDGNAVSSSGGAGTAPDDFDRVCHQVTITDDAAATPPNQITDACPPVLSATNTNGATALSFVTEANPSSSIFTGGGSKDPQDINQWAWKDAGGLPDKDNLEHGFAARYSKDSSPSCQGAGGDVTGATKCEMLYFGNDRFDNSGDAQQGFWFFQNKIGLNGGPNGGGTGFTGLHRTGDVLIISDFSIGGTISTITVYTWDPGCTATNIPKSGPVPGVSCGDANLRFQATSSNANCGAPDQVDPAITGFCGIVNHDPNTPAPWPYADKTTTNTTTHLANTYLQGEYFEGGLNLSRLNLGGECFASVASETRSSTSTTATLKDFVLGDFGHCDTTLVTTPKDSTGANIPATGISITTAGSIQVKDSALLTVNGVQSFTGTLTFHLCGPIAIGDTCATGGTLVNLAGNPPGTNTVTTNGTYSSGLATITSAANDTTGAPGHYCWRADFTSGTTGVPNGSDSSTTECFLVNPVEPTISTTATTTVVIGNPIDDTATLTGTANQPGSPVINPTTAGAAAGGTITFKLYGPSATADCSATATLLATSVVNVSGDSSASNLYKASAGTITGTLTPTAPGNYWWTAAYSGNNPNTLSKSGSCGDTGEKTTVGSTSVVTTPKDSTGASIPAGGISITTAGSITVKDSALLTVNGISSFTGTLTFHLCGPIPIGDTCASGGTAVDLDALAGNPPGSNTVTANGTYLSAGAIITSAANNTTGAPGHYCWRANFVSGTPGVPGASDSSATECFLVNPVTPTISTTATTTVVIGNPIDDTATLTGTANQPGSPVINPTTAGAAAGGTITFKLYGPSATADCSATATLLATSVVNVSGDSSASNLYKASAGTITGTLTPTAVGNYWWTAAYSGNNPNTLSKSGSCGDTGEQTTVTGSASLATAQRWLPNDTAHVTSTAGTTLAGTVTFTLYNDGTCGPHAAVPAGGTVQFGPQTKDVVTDANPGGTANNRFVSTTNTAFLVDSSNDAVAWSWWVTYHDNTLQDPAGTCESTTPAFTVNP